MEKVELHMPSLEELWFRQKCMSDPKTMAYNAGYDVSYFGYHYDSGCIDFPEEKWETWHNEKMKNPNFFYAYIVEKEENVFVGYCNFNLDKSTGYATMGIVIKDEFRGKGYMSDAMKLLILKAKEKGVKVLTDSVPLSREKALNVFYKLGFEKKDEITMKKFGLDEQVALIEKVL